MIKKAGSKLILSSMFAIVLLCAAVEKVTAQENRIVWVPFEEAQIEAKNSGSLIFTNVWAPWCGWCKKYEKEVYPEISELLENQFILTRLNRDDRQNRQLFGNRRLTPFEISRVMNVQSVPAIAIMNHKREVLFLLEGFVGKDELVQILNQVAKN